jgi:shikimate dehydrogenase
VTTAPPASLPGRLVLLGHPVTQSLSPAFQNAALRAADIPLTYEAIDVPPARLGDVLDALVAERAAGNVTVPHKEAVFARCDRVTPMAAQVGAVNTWQVLDGQLVGDNTDVGGCQYAVDELLAGLTADEVPDSWNSTAIVGAGGAAAAVIWALQSRDPNGTVRIWNRTAARAAALADRARTVTLAIEVVESLAECVDGAWLVINTTSLGLRDDDPFPVPLDLLTPQAAVLDLVYKPNETRWVREARARGHRAADGLTMLIEQGALSFERWFGVAPDRDVMWAAVGGRRRTVPTADAAG